MSSPVPSGGDVEKAAHTSPVVGPDDVSTVVLGNSPPAFSPGSVAQPDANVDGAGNARSPVPSPYIPPGQPSPGVSLSSGGTTLALNFSPLDSPARVYVRSRPGGDGTADQAEPGFTTPKRKTPPARTWSASPPGGPARPNLPAPEESASKAAKKQAASSSSTPTKESPSKATKKQQSPTIRKKPSVRAMRKDLLPQKIGNIVFYGDTGCSVKGKEDETKSVIKKPAARKSVPSLACKKQPVKKGAMKRPMAAPRAVMKRPAAAPKMPIRVPADYLSGTCFDDVVMELSFEFEELKDHNKKFNLGPGMTWLQFKKEGLAERGWVQHGRTWRLQNPRPVNRV